MPAPSQLNDLLVWHSSPFCSLQPGLSLYSSLLNRRSRFWFLCWFQNHTI